MLRKLLPLAFWLLDTDLPLEQTVKKRAAHFLRLYSTASQLNAILNYWPEELLMNYVGLAIALG